MTQRDVLLIEAGHQAFAPLVADDLPVGAASTWRDGSGAPSDGLGANGDYYLDDATGNVYLRSAGTYSIVANIKGATGSTGAAGSNGTNGTNGTNGADGKTVRSGSGAPSGGLGVDGDFYIDTTAHTIYGPKAGGAWGSSTSIIGPTGATGPAGPAASVATDSIWDAAGDLAVGTGADTAARLAITVPAANILEVLGVVNGETTASWKAVHDGTSPEAIGTAAAGTALTAAHRDHVHATGAGTPSTQAFGDAAVTGTGPAAAMTDHKHAMPTAQLASWGSRF